MDRDWIANLDFGSQYTHLITRRIREHKVYSGIVPYNIGADELSARKPKAVILSGGPASVTAAKSPVCDKDIFNMGIPVLGICYGAQLMAKLLEGNVAKAKTREYGKATLSIRSKKTLFKDLLSKETIWMSHGDRITKLPKGFRVIGSTSNSPVAAMEHPEKNFFGVQFHPESILTKYGKQFLKNFLKI